jgi:hypothetical protein
MDESIDIHRIAINIIVNGLLINSNLIIFIIMYIFIIRNNEYECL